MTTKKSITAGEIALVLEEAALKGGILSDIRQNSFSSLTLTFHRKDKGRVLLFISLAAPVCMYEIPDKKPGTAKLQRFIQFARSVVTPAKVMEVYQVPNEREVRFTLKHLDETICMYVRLFSASKANVVITDKRNMILEALFRRPQEGVMKGNAFVPSQSREEDSFGVRERDFKYNTFSMQLMDYYESATDVSESLFQYRFLLLENEWKRESQRMRSSIKSLQAALDNSRVGSLEDKIRNIDYSSVSGCEIDELYNALKSEKRKNEVNAQRLADESAAFSKLESEYESACASHDAALVRELYERIRKSRPGNSKSEQHQPFVRCMSEGGVEIAAGRNSSENEALLRNFARGNDLFLHLRGESGCYVIIKVPKNKSVPLNALLDAAELALFYSGRKTQGELHKAFVKDVRKIKGGKPGAVAIMRDSNLFYKSDPARLKSVLSKIGTE